MSSVGVGAGVVDVLRNLGGFTKMTGSCDEPIPWETTIEHSINAMCCCE